MASVGACAPGGPVVTRRLGECSVCGSTGRQLLTTTFAEPGTLLLSDDRRTLHAVSPIRPRSGSMAARRDVLVITFASVWP